MVKKIEDIKPEEIDAFRREIEEISVSKSIRTASEKSEMIKLKIKKFFKDFSYIEIFKQLKESKINGNSRKTYGSIYELALEELLEEKKKLLSEKEIDGLLDYFQDETNKTRKFIKDTKSTLLTQEEIEEKAKKLTAEDLNYKRLAVAAKEGNLSEDQKTVFKNEGSKVDISKKEASLNVIDDYERDLSRELSSRIEEDPKKL